MPQIPVDECPAGPAIDAAVAEALGWHEDTGWWMDKDNEIQEAACIGCNSKSTWSPSTDITEAWELWEKAETAPLAICRAFLKANGVEYVEVPE
jgi:hypothetical protein